MTNFYEIGVLTIVFIIVVGSVIVCFENSNRIKEENHELVSLSVLLFSIIMIIIVVIVLQIIWGNEVKK